MMGRGKLGLWPDGVRTRPNAYGGPGGGESRLQACRALVRHHEGRWVGGCCSLPVVVHKDK